MNHPSKGILYLIPSDLGAGTSHTIPEYVKSITHGLSFFIVENEKSARHYLKHIAYPLPLNDLQLFLLNKHTSEENQNTYLQPLLQGISVGLISEAGCPAVADPGASIVALCHKKGIQIVPLVGPSSILLALMASGFNGQNFAFLGYIPIPTEQRKNYIRQIENHALKTGQTQIFIETPFRNSSLIKDLLAVCKPTTKLCIAASLTLPNERICSQSIAAWKTTNIHLEKNPCVFLLQA